MLLYHPSTRNTLLLCIYIPPALTMYPPLCSVLLFAQLPLFFFVVMSRGSAAPPSWPPAPIAANFFVVSGIALPRVVCDVSILVVWCVRFCYGWGRSGTVQYIIKFVELDERQDGNAIRYELSQITGRTSVPQIWIGGEFVGGCNDGEGFLGVVFFRRCTCGYCIDLHTGICSRSEQALLFLPEHGG